MYDPVRWHRSDGGGCFSTIAAQMDDPAQNDHDDDDEVGMDQKLQL